VRAEQIVQNNKKRNTPGRPSPCSFPESDPSVIDNKSSKLKMGFLIEECKQRFDRECPGQQQSL